jgi:ABC-type dipeptide/oligopeptide/nickel transport system permease subunit
MIRILFILLSVITPAFVITWYCLDWTILFASDIFFFIFLESIFLFIAKASSNAIYIDVGERIIKNKLAAISLIIILCYGSIATLDSIHYRKEQLDASGKTKFDNDNKPLYSNIRSLLDTVLIKYYRGVNENNGNILFNTEKRYSKPFASTEFDPAYKANLSTGKNDVVYAPLKYPGAHILGTDKAGGDIFYKILKGTRTAIIVGLITTLIAVPFAMAFGITAGYFGGAVDDIIQFIYTTISSIPSILLITSLVLIVKNLLQAKTSEAIQRQDDSLLLGLCIILGLLGWSGLCRLLRAETLKLKELDFVQAARALGTSHFNIILKHIVPNVTHIILISFILQFSGLVMVEAILSYLKIGVPSTIGSWGRIIDEARNELSRDPIVYWPLLGSFLAMFILILAVNFLGDVIRDALDPKLRKG